MKLSMICALTALFLCFTYLDCYHNSSIAATLKLVHVIFRHGDRTPVSIPGYHQLQNNVRYCPYGPGQLTNNGKRNAYTLGKWLRKRYGKFLKRIYSRGVLRAFTTNYDRTQASLQLLLAGLYPPKGTLLEWNSGLNWNPIPYRVLRLDSSILMVPGSHTCQPFWEDFFGYHNTEAGERMMNRYSSIKGIMEYNTNKTFNSIAEYIAAYDLLSTQGEFEMEVPKWAYTVMPTLKHSAEDYFQACTATTRLKQISVGHLLQKIVTDTKAKLNNTVVPIKLYLYSGHDQNVGSFLRLFHFTQRPSYSSCAIIEVHSINNIDGIKIFYRNSNRTLLQLEIPQCGKFCPLSKFVKLFEEVFSNNTSC